MREENMLVLVNHLKVLGFEKGVNEALQTAICLKPERFELRNVTKEVRATTIVSVQFQLSGGDEYTLPFYDVTLRKDICFPKNIAYVNELSAIDKEMCAVDWLGQPFGKFVRTDMKLPSLEDSRTVSGIIDQLRSLEISGGKEAANLLRYKHWADTPLESFIPGFSVFKAQFEVSQRFYFFEGEEPISRAEAVRFLNSRWMEKQMHARKKANSQNGESGIDEQSVDGKPRGSGLLSKKKKIPRKKITRQ